MKNLLLAFCCLLSISAISQTKDSVSNEINELKTGRNNVVTRLDKVKNGIINQLLLEEEVNVMFDNTLMKMDSLSGIKVKLERKKQLTTQEQAQLNKVIKQLDAQSNKIQEIDSNLREITSKRRETIRELQKAMDLLKSIDLQIKELEGVTKR